MNEYDAFGRLWDSEGNAARAAMLLSFAFVAKVAGWDALDINGSRRRDARNAFERAGMDPAAVEFGVALRAGEVLAPERVEALRCEIEGQFGTLVVNMRGHQYKKREWRDRHNRVAEGGEEA
jgi:hypothetical protein